MQVLDKNIAIAKPHFVLKTMFSQYKRPNDKISYEVKTGEIIPIKKGLYLHKSDIGPDFYTSTLANTLYGPSYISLSSALAFYNLIPESVYTVQSVTTCRSKVFKTFLGNFKYYYQNPDVFSQGIRNIKIDELRSFLVATPEKAICDTLLFTKHLRVSSADSLRTYLEEDLRFDLDERKNWNTDFIRMLAMQGRKRTLLETLATTLDNYSL